ncbi:MAG: hypothetical protein QGD94_12730, partial [Planctomycetia bacterium]|nr:hypothetical protein [Planctomycetia bacterium]
MLFINFHSHEALQRRANRQQRMVLRINPHRGSILDRRFRILASSVDVDSAFGDPSQIEDIWEVSRLVAPMLGVSARGVRDKLAGGV